MHRSQWPTSCPGRVRFLRPFRDEAVSSSPPPLRFGLLLLAPLAERCSLGTAPHCGAASSSPPPLRFGLLLLAPLDKRCSLGTAPHCGASSSSPPPPRFAGLLLAPLGVS